MKIQLVKLRERDDNSQKDSKSKGGLHKQII